MQKCTRTKFIFGFLSFFQIAGSASSPSPISSKSRPVVCASSTEFPLQTTSPSAGNPSLPSANVISLAASVNPLVGPTSASLLESLPKSLSKQAFKDFSTCDASLLQSAPSADQPSPSNGSIGSVDIVYPSSLSQNDKSTAPLRKTAYEEASQRGNLKKCVECAQVSKKSSLWMRSVDLFCDCVL